MNLPEISLNTIHNFFNEKDVVTNTILQIKKDFSWIGVDFEYENDTEKVIDLYANLHKKIVFLVGDLTNSDFDKLKAFLYRADITEQEIKKTEFEIPNYSLIEVLAHQIIIKALKKVLFRQYYSYNFS